MFPRLEKDWGLEFRPDFNAIESGMDIFINWKKDFVEKDTTLKFKQEGVTREFVTLTIETESDVTLDEAVLKDGEAIGCIISILALCGIGNSFGCRNSWRVLLGRDSRCAAI